MKAAWRQRVVCGGVLVGALLLAGCGGDDGAEAEPTATPTAAATTPEPEPTPMVTATPEPTEAAQVHVVVSGETLGAIASRYGVTVEAIVEANGLTDPDRLAIGDELEIPTGG